MNAFSPPQIAGYLSFVLGVSAFLQKKDRRLKALNSVQSLTYAIHFVMLGNAPAAASALVSSARTYLSIRYRSVALAAGFVALFVAAGVVFAKSPAGWLTIVASSVATVAMFTLKGVPLRLVLLSTTVMWLVNNVMSGSIGGVILELAVAAINISTTVSLMREPGMRRVEARVRTGSTG